MEEDNALDLLIYGSLINRVTSGFWPKLNSRLFLLVPDNKDILQWVSEDKSPGKSRILISKITRIFFGVKDTERLKGMAKKLAGKEHLCIGIICDKEGDFKSSLELVFETHDHLRLFVTGIQLIVNKSLSSRDQGSLQDRRIAQIRRLWAEVDSDANSHLDIKEVDKLLVKLNFNFEKAYLKFLFSDFDKDKSGGIDFKEFEVLLEALRSHSEVKEIF